MLPEAGTTATPTSSATFIDSDKVVSAAANPQSFEDIGAELIAESAEQLEYQNNDGNTINFSLRFIGKEFSITKCDNSIECRFDGDFEHDLDLDNPATMQSLRSLPQFIRHTCLDIENRLMCYPICHKGKSYLLPPFLNAECGSKKDRIGGTPLHLACASQDLETVKATIELGGSAALSVKNNFGSLPIVVAYNQQIKDYINELQQQQ